jgi:hypothetical protein
MNQRHIIALSTIGALGLALLPGTAVSQQRSLKDQLVGTWAIVSQEQTLPNGSKVQPLGANPKGVNIYNANGSFYILYVRSDLPKMASNNRLTPTPEEAKAIALGSIVIVGTYTVNEAKKTIAVRPDASTFANLVGTQQNWTIASITADELKYSLEAMGGGGQILTTFTRAK